MPEVKEFDDTLLQMAPLAGVTDFPMREMAGRWGSGRTWTEMISSEALVRRHRLTREMLPEASERGRVHVQLFGIRPESLAESARMAEEAGAWGVDLNLGCPAWKVVKGGAGAALLNDLPRVVLLVRAMRGAVTVPLSLKIRSGWNAPDREMLSELSRMASGEGVDFLCFHPRFREQQFKGRADWELLAWFVEQSSLPVIGSGDVIDGQTAGQMLRRTGCRGLMIGRAVLGAPWVFGRIRQFLSQGVDPGQPPAGQRLEEALEHVRLALAKYGPDRGIRIMRKHLAWYVKSIPDARRFRAHLVRVESMEQLSELVEQIKMHLKTVCEEV